MDKTHFWHDLTYLEIPHLACRYAIRIREKPDTASKVVASDTYSLAPPTDNGLSAGSQRRVLIHVTETVAGAHPHECLVLAKHDLVQFRRVNQQAVAINTGKACVRVVAATADRKAALEECDDQHGPRDLWRGLWLDDAGRRQPAGIGPTRVHGGIVFQWSCTFVEIVELENCAADATGQDSSVLVV